MLKLFFTSAGNPKTWTAYLKEKKNITVVHVVSSLKFALKAQAAGVDAVVAEGFEAGGHNGRDETTTLTLIPAVKEVLDIPPDCCRRYCYREEHVGRHGPWGRWGANWQ